MRNFQPFYMSILSLFLTSDEPRIKKRLVFRRNDLSIANNCNVNDKNDYDQIWFKWLDFFQ